MQLHDYQSKVVADVQKSIKAGARSVLVVSPTGSGKTRMVSTALGRMKKSCLAVAHRIEICSQIRAEFARTGPNRSFVNGIGSAYSAAAVKSGQYEIIFVDEAHHIAAASYRRLVENRGQMILIGATATPYRADGASLVPFFDSVVVAPTVHELSEGGHLAKIGYVASNDVDFEGIKLQKKGEFEEEDALARVRVAVQAGDVATAWRKYADGRHAIVYAINLQHCEQIRDELQLAGFRCAIVSSRVGKRERGRIITDFQAGRLQAVVNCEVFTEGTDLKGVGAIIMLRPTTSRALYKQMIGRGMRPDKHCMVIDHVGNFLRHGNVLTEDPIEIMQSAKLTGTIGGGTEKRSMSVKVERMDLHVEKVQSSLKRIWTPNVFEV